MLNIRGLLGELAHKVLGIRRSLSIRHLGYRISVDARDRSGRLIYIRYLKTGHWHHEEFEKGVVKSVIKKANRAWFIDVGASYGMYSLLAAHNAEHEHLNKIIAIEGSPKTFGWLKQNIRQNGLGSRISAFNLAISDTNGTQVGFFRHDQFSEWSRIGGSLDGPLTCEAKVTSSTLDALLQDQGWRPPDPLIIKMDIEGGEPSALRGLVKTLREAHSCIALLEFHVRLLDKAGSGAEALAKQVLDLKPDVIYEMNDSGKCLREIDGKAGFDALIKRCRAGQKLPEIMTNIIFGPNSLRTLEGVRYEAKDD